jgi:hypothetical protein
LKKKWLTSSLILLLLSVSSSAFAASNPLDKYKNIEVDKSTNSDITLSVEADVVPPNDLLAKYKNLQNGDDDSMLPELSMGDVILSSEDSGNGTHETSDEIKAYLSDDVIIQLPELQIDADNDPSFDSYFKLGVAQNLSGDRKNAINNIQKSIKLDATSKDAYKELVKLYAADQPKKIHVFVNGEKLTFEDTAPVIIDNSTLVPIRKIIETLGAKVTWDENTNTALIELNGKKVTLKQGSKNAYVDGELTQLNTAAQNINGHLLVPLRFISESFLKKVDYIPGDNGTAIIPIND